MILSRAEIPWPRARNPYEMHRAIWRLFPGEARESRRAQNQPRQGFLYRVEENRPGRRARVLVQSRQPPQPDPGLSLIASREISPQPTPGQRLAFILTANPIKTIKDKQANDKPNKARNTCRVPLTTEEAQQAWLSHKFADAAKIEAAAITPHQPLYFRKGNRGGKIVYVTFDGILTVLDPKSLIALLENGIGPAKAFGCGLLLVRRLG